MLKVNSRSSANGGSGSTIIARIITTTSGAAIERIALAFGPSQACNCCNGFIQSVSGKGAGTREGAAPLFRRVRRT